MDATLEYQQKPGYWGYLERLLGTLPTPARPPPLALDALDALPTPPSPLETRRHGLAVALALTLTLTSYLALSPA